VEGCAFCGKRRFNELRFEFSGFGEAKERRFEFQVSSFGKASSHRSGVGLIWPKRETRNLKRLQE
jgi:hypothetical protein